MKFLQISTIHGTHYNSDNSVPVIKVYDLVEQERSACCTCKSSANQLVTICQVGVAGSTSIQPIAAYVIEKYSTHGHRGSYG